MRSFWQIFSLEIVAFVRAKAFAMVLVASSAWVLLLPRLLTDDGTVGGARELDLHYALGGVFLLLVLTLLATATGSLARERTVKRLQLTMVRPVRYAVIVLAKIAALMTCGAAVLAVSAALLACRVSLSTPCHHVLKPLLPTVREEAKTMYKSYLEDPETPAQVKKASPATILRILENRALDRYDTLPTNALTRWRFPLEASTPASSSLAVRMRFTNQFDVRQNVRGAFRLGAACGVVSNITQAILTVPLTGSRGEETELVFENRGNSALMVRPRRDVELLISADAFWKNLLRAYAELVAILALVLSFGLFLSAALSRPVAIFVAIVTLIVSEMSPSVLDQYPEELGAKLTDRIGLALSRVAADVTHPVSALDPLARLSKDECIEPREVVRVLAFDFLLGPPLFSILAGFILPRKQDEL